MHVCVIDAMYIWPVHADTLTQINVEVKVLLSHVSCQSRLAMTSNDKSAD